MGNSSSQSVTSCGTEAAATGKTVPATVSTITTGQNRTLSKGRSFMKFGRRLTSINSKDVSAAAAENTSKKHHSVDDDFCNILIPKAGQSDNEITVKPAGLGDVKKKVKKKSADLDNSEVQDDTSTVNNAKEICLYEFLKGKIKKKCFSLMIFVFAFYFFIFFSVFVFLLLFHFKRGK